MNFLEKSMQLDEVEQFALRQLFNAGDTPGAAAQAFRYRVQERSITAAGFFSILKCLHRSEHIQPLQEISKSFTLNKRPWPARVFVCSLREGVNPARCSMHA